MFRILTTVISAVLIWEGIPDWHSKTFLLGIGGLLFLGMISWFPGIRSAWRSRKRAKTEKRLTLQLEKTYKEKQDLPGPWLYLYRLCVDSRHYGVSHSLIEQFCQNDDIKKPPLPIRGMDLILDQCDQCFGERGCTVFHYVNIDCIEIFECRFYRIGDNYWRRKEWSIAQQS